MSTPTAIGPYQVIRQIGDTMTGPVYMARHEDEHWAVKLITDSHGRLTDTAYKLVGDVLHDRLVRYKAVDTAESGSLYLVTDYVQGQPLQRRGIRHLAMADRLGLLCDLLGALAFLHDKQMVHGGLHASAVVLHKIGSQLHGLLIDAGVQPVVTERNRPLLLRQAYPAMAPELITAYERGDHVELDEALAPAIDVYAAGLLVAEVLGGRPLFADARSAHELIEQKRHTAVRLAGTSDPHRTIDVAAVDAVVRDACDPDPARRPVDAGTFVARLRDALPSDAAAPS